MPGTLEIIFAHSVPGTPEAQWEPLITHARLVGDLAADFGARFNAREAARLAGYLHDTGKVSAAFQSYICGKGLSPDHSTAGAKLAESHCAEPMARMIARLVAFAIAGHHAGLADGPELIERLVRPVPDFSAWASVTPPLPAQIMPQLVPGGSASRGYKLAFLGRMLFSCLVDADFLATEEFYAKAEGRPPPPRGGHTPLDALRQRLDRHLARFAGAQGWVNERRAEILANARAKAALAPGLFTMTVPTGGGKTLASLAFALDHAIAHGLDRVVYVIPYTSIIEQTAAVFRAALGDDDVLEHTGTVDWDAQAKERDDEGARDALAKLRRAAENWDVPVVVTTAVQLFESLHANRPSRCRKLHRLAKSVIVLDEAQTLPLPLLKPCLAAIDTLAGSYGASVVLCTATQPAVTQQAGFKAERGGLDIPPERELAPDPEALYRDFRRVRVVHAGARTDAELAEHVAARDQLLCIVNSRKHAQALYALIRDLPGARHLTTLMCPAHRRLVLAGVRRALKDGQPVRLVATSLIEAGVDVDFPEVWRAENGLDSIAQAAGRCNREGRRAEATLFVFGAADHPLPAQFNQQVGAMAAALRAHGEDPLGLAAVRAYFEQLYWTKGDAQLDAAKLHGNDFPILKRLADSQGFMNPPEPPYASIAEAFRMIDDVGRPVIVPWRGGDDPEAVKRLSARLDQADFPPRDVLRGLQQYTVTIPERLYREMLANGAVQPIANDKYGDRFMRVEDVGLYSEEAGLSLDPFAMDGLF